MCFFLMQHIIINTFELLFQILIKVFFTKALQKKTFSIKIFRLK